MSTGKLRQISTTFWTDPYVRKSPKDVKLLYVYLLTNMFTNMLGIYEIDIDQMAFDLGISTGEISKAIDFLQKDKKIIYADGYVLLANWHKYQSLNQMMGISAARAFNSIPDTLKARFSGGKYASNIPEGEISECISAIFGNNIDSIPTIPLGGPGNPKKDPPQKKKAFIPPTIQEVIDYFQSKGYKRSAAVKAFNYYEEGDPKWTDSQGSPVRAWKQKMQIWFKDENREELKMPKKFVPGPDDVLDMDLTKIGKE